LIALLPGELLLVQVTNGQDLEQGQISTQLREPAKEEEWGGRRLVSVITHSGQGSNAGGGHYVTYVREDETWWRVDSLPQKASIENPFLMQHRHKITMLAFRAEDG
jgi:hypothetical protein